MEDLFYVEIKDFIVGNGNTYYNINSKIMMKKREKAYEEKNYVDRKSTRLNSSHL